MPRGYPGKLDSAESLNYDLELLVLLSDLGGKKDDGE